MSDEPTATRALDEFAHEHRVGPQEQVELLLEFIEFELGIDDQFIDFLEEKRKKMPR